MRTSGKHLTLLLLIVIAGVALRIFHLDHAGIWIDEKISLAESNGCIYRTQPFENYFTTSEVKQNNTLENVIRATIKEDGGNGILYVLKLHYWQQFFGSGDSAIRMLSVVFNCFIIIIAYYFSISIFKSNRVALITALLIAVHPLLVSYSQEARPYSIATMFSLLSTLFFFKTFVNVSSSQYFKHYVIAYAFFSLCALFSHYFTVYIFLGQGFYFLFYVRGKKLWTTYILTWLGIISVLTLWMLNGGLEGLHFMNLHNEQYIKRMQALKEGENSFLLVANFKNTFLGWLQVLLAAAGNTLQQAGYQLRQLTIFLIIPIFLVLAAFKKSNATLKNNMTLLVILAFAAPVYFTILALIAGHTLSFQPAYGIFTAPYIMILVGYGCEKLITGEYKNWIKTITIVSLGCLMCASLYFRYSSNMRTYSASHPNPLIALSQKIELESIPNDTIVFYSFRDAVITNIYLPENIKSMQMVDTNIQNKVILKNSNKVLFDFENGKYRY